MTERQLYADVRAGFIAQHTSLNKWCKDNGVQRQNARAALLEFWTGDKANELCRRLIEASGIDCRSSEKLTATETATKKSLSQFSTD